MPDAANQLVVFEDAADHAILPGESLQAPADVGFGVIDAFRVVHPWQPLPRMIAVIAYQRIKFISVNILEDAQLEVIVDAETEHDSKPANGPEKKCATKARS